MSVQTSSGTGAFRTAVVPAAGLGTRFLPTTKAVPKELLPVVDTPGIELVAAEAAEAGAQRLLIVTSPGKDSVAAYFRTDDELVKTLEGRGKGELADKVRRAPGLLEVDSVYQYEPKGLGHAVAGGIRDRGSARVICRGALVAGRLRPVGTGRCQEENREPVGQERAMHA